MPLAPPTALGIGRYSLTVQPHHVCHTALGSHVLSQSRVRTQATSGLWLEFVAKKKAVEPGVTPQAFPQTNLATLGLYVAMAAHAGAGRLMH